MQLTLWHIVQPSSSKYRTMRVPRFYLWSLEESSLAVFDLFFLAVIFFAVRSSCIHSTNTLDLLHFSQIHMKRSDIERQTIRAPFPSPLLSLPPILFLAVEEQKKYFV